MPRLRTVLPVIASLCCMAGSTGNVFAQPIPEKSAVFPPGNIRPTLLDFVTGLPISYRMQVASTPRLLRPPFADQPTKYAKGLASVIKAEQLDVKNRVKAVRFLGKQDCMTPGSEKEAPKPSEAQMVLIDTMNGDRSEVVRYEAVLALENQLSRGPCGKIKRDNRGRYENCLGCCNPIVLTALARRAYDADITGCPLEPSERVREACIHAMCVCGIDCYGGQPMQMDTLQGTDTEIKKEDDIPQPNKKEDSIPQPLKNPGIETPEPAQ